MTACTQAGRRPLHRWRRLGIGRRRDRGRPDGSARIRRQRVGLGERRGERHQNLRGELQRPVCATGSQSSHELGSRDRSSSDPRRQGWRRSGSSTRSGPAARVRRRAASSHRRPGTVGRRPWPGRPRCRHRRPGPGPRRSPPQMCSRFRGCWRCGCAWRAARAAGGRPRQR
jgi:hypothetical protein